MTHSVIIDGVVYVEQTEKQRVIDEEVTQLLSAVYGRLWAEAYYDPYNEMMQDFAIPLADKMSRLNEILKFKK